jgi:hypothetical protein
MKGWLYVKTAVDIQQDDVSVIFVYACQHVYRPAAGLADHRRRDRSRVMRGKDSVFIDQNAYL